MFHFPTVVSTCATPSSLSRLCVCVLFWVFVAVATEVPQTWCLVLLAGNDVLISTAVVCSSSSKRLLQSRTIRNVLLVGRVHANVTSFANRPRGPNCHQDIAVACVCVCVLSGSKRYFAKHTHTQTHVPSRRCSMISPPTPPFELWLKGGIIPLILPTSVLNHMNCCEAPVDPWPHLGGEV